MKHAFWPGIFSNATMVLWMTGQSWYDEGLFYPHSQFGSKALRADAYETVACAWLSLTTLVGLILNAALGCWWADPVAALVLVPLVVREGLESLRGDDGDD